ncbi:hypothetical protein WH47_08720 [Habropoda laboriosa]|uniref:BCL-6 corepressor-like protein 1 n=1 Tax=Habropoda laboriosa TaxID=597456 RepID=A0A0L7QP02_9HYME|nr:hypothetical protein WH47_08720 [Habropoda laboriosa]
MRPTRKQNTGPGARNESAGFVDLVGRVKAEHLRRYTNPKNATRSPTDFNRDTNCLLLPRFEEFLCPLPSLRKDITFDYETKLFLILFCEYALAAKTEETKQSKRGISDSGEWIGIPNSHAYGHGQPWLHDPVWKGHKFPPFDLAHSGLHEHLPYDKVPAIPLPIGSTDYLKTIPVYITKHVVLERPVPVPEPVYIEKPYHVPVPVEKVIHKTIPVPVPVPEPIPVPVKHPVPIPVQQPYPVPVKQVFPVPVPVPVPIPVHPQLFAGPAVPYGRGYGGGHFYPPFHGPPLHPHFVHVFGHGFGHGFSNEYGHGHGYGHPPPAPPPPPPYGHDYGHEHEHKKRSKD